MKKVLLTLIAVFTAFLSFSTLEIYAEPEFNDYNVSFYNGSDQIYGDFVPMDGGYQVENSIYGTGFKLVHQKYITVRLNEISSNYRQIKLVSETDEWELEFDMINNNPIMDNTVYINVNEGKLEVFYYDLPDTNYITQNEYNYTEDSLINIYIMYKEPPFTDYEISYNVDDTYYDGIFVPITDGYQVQNAIHETGFKLFYQKYLRIDLRKKGSNYKRIKLVSETDNWELEFDMYHGRDNDSSNIYIHTKDGKLEVFYYGVPMSSEYTGYITQNEYNYTEDSLIEIYIMYKEPPVDDNEFGISFSTSDPNNTADYYTVVQNENRLQVVRLDDEADYFRHEYYGVMKGITFNQTVYDSRYNRMIIDHYDSGGEFIKSERFDITNAIDGDIFITYLGDIKIHTYLHGEIKTIAQYEDESGSGKIGAGSYMKIFFEKGDPYEKWQIDNENQYYYYQGEISKDVGFVDIIRSPEGQDLEYAITTAGVSGNWQKVPDFDNSTPGEQLDRTFIETTMVEDVKKWTLQTLPLGSPYSTKSVPESEPTKYSFRFKAPTYRERYTITLYVDGQTYETDYQWENSPYYFGLPPKKQGYIFKGWFTEMSAQNQVATGTIFDQDTILYAKFDPIIHFSIGFYIDNILYMTRSVIENERIVLIQPPEKEDHVFVGWYTDAELVDQVPFNHVATSDMQLYAKYVDSSSLSDPTVKPKGIPREAIIAMIGIAVLFGGVIYLNRKK